MKPIMGGKYRRKIKSAEAVAEIVGPRPRAKKVVMCHGTFDIVHPGHIRHLIYAREKGDILVASLTCDSHVTKADFRPFVPEELRAMNLAALEVVDYVIIDDEPTPLANLARIKPDYFVKGFEYVAAGMHPRTQEEKAVIEAYGGEIIFTPGDVVYSSSAIIEAGPPNLALEKLGLLLEGEGLGFAALRRALETLSGARVHVVGDTVVDSLTRTTLIGANAKTPTFSVRYEGRHDYVGGAGVVAKHLAAAGAEVTFSTVLGDDALKDFVLADLARVGVDARAVIDPTRPTTNKNAFVAGDYRLLKMDTLDNRAVSDRILERLLSAVSGQAADIVVFSDFRHGLFNRDTIPPLVAAVPAAAFRVADSQVASRWGNILDFRGFDLITPNEREARFALGDQDTVIRPLGSALYEHAGCATLILKLGPRGLITFRRPTGESGGNRSFFAVDSLAEEVRDAVGAGDALLAYATLALCATGDEVIASVLGSLAAACACADDGNAPVAPAEIGRRLDAIERRLVLE